MWAIAKGLFGRVFGVLGAWKWVLLGATLAFVAGTGVGYRYKDNKCDAAAAKVEVVTLREQVASLEENLRQMREVTSADAEQAVKDARKLADLRKKAKAVLDQISGGVCLNAADVARVRDYFQLGK